MLLGTSGRAAARPRRAVTSRRESGKRAPCLTRFRASSLTRRNEAGLSRVLPAHPGQPGGATGAGSLGGGGAGGQASQVASVLVHCLTPASLRDEDAVVTLLSLCHLAV